MWVRTQYRETLIEVNGFDFHFSTINAINKYNIIGYNTSNSDPNSYYSLGNYKTKEKALKVLDMIQKKLESEGIYKGTEVFQMPQDDEVEE